MNTPSVNKLINDNELANGLIQAANDKELATKFWQSLTGRPASQIAVNSSNVQRFLLSLLYSCKRADPKSYEEIHKGNPYYFLGIASYLMHDYQTAIFFFDASVTEDLRYGADAKNDPTPSTRFLALEGDVEGQAAKQLTQLAESKVQRAIDFYNSMPGRQQDISDLTISGLREKFLFPALSPQTSPGWRTLATVFISFFIEWDFRNELFDLRPDNGTSEIFYLHLFKGCVLFESLLKENPRKKTKGGDLRRVLGELYKELGMNSSPKISSTFKKILGAIPNADNSIETAICFTGKVRNTTGHKLSWDEHIKKIEYQRLFEMISASCLHTISCLY